MAHVCMDVGLEANTRSIMEDPPEWKCVGSVTIYLSMNVLMVFANLEKREPVLDPKSTLKSPSSTRLLSIQYSEKNLVVDLEYQQEHSGDDRRFPVSV